MASPPGSAASFAFVGHAMLCPATGNPKCTPDQEHIAADPNPSSTGPINSMSYGGISRGL
jgi:hypothetical protein